MSIEEQVAYDAWLERVRPLLEAKQWGEAMKDVPRLPELEAAVPHPLSRPLAEATIALVSSAGISAPGQEPMDGPNIEGDYTIRLLDIDAPLHQLVISQTHFDTGPAYEDPNVVYPIDRLKELQQQGIIGQVAPQGVSFMGFFTNAFRIRDEVAPAIVAALHAQNVDGAVLVPV